MSFRLKTMLGITLIQSLLLFTLIWNGAHALTSSFAISAVLVAALLSYLFAMHLTRRLDTLKTASQRIAEGVFGHQIPVQGRDELAQTAAAFNDMSHRLYWLDIERKQAAGQITQLNLDLEARVALRTHQLASANKELEHLALHDALTKLPNRTLLHDRVEQAILLSKREKKSFALLSLDLDKFKPINDTLGHHAGDLVLQEASIRLEHCLRQSDTVARMGGDEFAILLLNVTTTEEVMVIVNKIIRAIIKPIAINGKTLAIGTSIGIAMFPAHGDDLMALMGHADSAMHAAKRTQNVYTFYNPGLENENDARLALQLDLRRAIDNNQLILHYQPKIDLRSECVTGVEALARWQHPERGLIYPDEFITSIEKNGLMKAFTLKVLETALRQCELWHESRMYLSMAVNISAINLQDPVFPDNVADLVEKFNVPPAYIELEITETAIMTDPLRAIENITRLSAMGLQVSIDDFGTGYSSMAYLQKLLVAKIKIDKSFVMDMDKNKNDGIIVRSTIDLGHNLGLKVIAEGVESQESWNRLKKMGCDSAQGYFMSRPISADQFARWIKESPFGSG